MNKFFNNDIFTCCGDEIEILYSPIVNDDGSIGLVESGKINIQEEIDSYAESCDIRTIIKRYEEGDLTALRQNIMNFGDFTKFPKTYAEMLQLQIDSNNLFNSLPKDVKQKFDNDCNKFFAMSGSKEWFDIINPIKEEIAGNKEENKLDES